MFSPIPPTDPQFIKLNRIRQMTNGKGVVVTLDGIGREYQWVIQYSDANIGLTAECRAYRSDHVDQSGDGPPKDFWNVDILSDLKQFADDHPGVDPKALLTEVGTNLAECLLKWPTRENDYINSFQAKSVNIRASTIGAFSVELPVAWRSSHG